MITAVNEPLEQVLAEYAIKVNKITLETYKEKKGVWWIDTEQGKKILKKMPMGRERLLFILSAVEHLDANGVNLPKFIKTKAGAPFVEIDEANYVLSEAVASRPPSYGVPAELAMIMQGMASFHVASRNFTPPEAAKIRSHLGAWPKTYLEQINDLKNFREQALENKESKFAAAYLEESDYFINLAEICLAALVASPYSKLVEGAAHTVNLCHQDFAAGNLGITNDGRFYVFDTDGITYDLPVRDIRKICNKVMKKRGLWDLDMFKEMLRTYSRINPLSLDNYEVLFIDLRYPHLFYGIASKYFMSREKEWPELKFMQRLAAMVKTEKSKIAVLDAAWPLSWLNPKI